MTLTAGTEIQSEDETTSETSSVCVRGPFRPRTRAAQSLLGAVAKMDGETTCWRAGSRTPLLFGWQATRSDGWLTEWMSALEQGA